MSQSICYYCMSFCDGRDPCPVCHSRTDYRNPPPALRAGTVLAGQYLVGRCVGRGGFGITYLGLDNLQRKVIIKEFFPKKIAMRSPGETVVQPNSDEAEDDYQQGIEVFLNEAITLAKFDDPNIGKIYYSFKENNAAYFVSPYKEGATLDEFVRRHPGGVPEDVLLEIMYQVFAGLNTVHRADIIHRDIKPSNIYLPNQEPPFLIDFGNARKFAAQSRLTVFLTHGYAPLEQYSENIKHGHQGPWSDVYSCAATMYASLRGQRSESGGLLPPTHAPDRLNGAELPDIEQTSRRAISPKTARAIMTGLELDHRKRPQSIAEFKALFEKPEEPAEPSRGWELLCLAGELEGERFSLSAKPLVMGRSAKHCDLVLSDTPENRSVSRRHCQIWLEGNRVQVMDLNSSHGTMINDLAAIEKGRSVVLTLGDYVSLAGNIVFEVVEAAGDGPAQPVDSSQQDPKMPPAREGATLATGQRKKGELQSFLKRFLFH